MKVYVYIDGGFIVVVSRDNARLDVAFSVYDAPALKTWLGLDDLTHANGIELELSPDASAKLFGSRVKDPAPAPNLATYKHTVLKRRQRVIPHVFTVEETKLANMTLVRGVHHVAY
jgi:hypothetical protein